MLLGQKIDFMAGTPNTFHFLENCFLPVFIKVIVLVGLVDQLAIVSNTLQATHRNKSNDVVGYQFFGLLLQLCNQWIAE